MIQFLLPIHGILFLLALSLEYNGQGSASPFPALDTTIWVDATAYNATEEQTKKGNVGVGAWGDHIKEGMNVIAVSNDLIEMGLTYKTEVRIEGFRKVYTVMDKMHPRWTRKIDIFMGQDREAAILWGKRRVKITFPVTD
ncbi:MAG: 3D domain-containing protein [Cyclobacteriaceae bacterium]|nr:3D domain-containing protein [Cyclobacteriaceae bacterium]